jgi:tetratricopeptide (TPR) repeat protein
MRAFFMVVGLALTSCGGAFAVSEADRIACDNPSEKPDVSIRACTAIIDASDMGYVLAIAYLNRGIAYLEKRSYDNAIADFDEVLSLEPQNEGAYFNRGVAHNGKGDYESAIADLNEAILLDPKDAEAHINRGNAYKNKGDLERAIADFDEALRLDPKLENAVNGKKIALELLAKRTAPR